MQIVFTISNSFQVCATLLKQKYSMSLAISYIPFVYHMSAQALRELLKGIWQMQKRDADDAIIKSKLKRRKKLGHQKRESSQTFLEFALSQVKF